MLQALPLSALEGTLISVALPWASPVFIVAALGTAYFAPAKTDLPLQALEVTTLVFATIAAFTAPSAVTLGTLGLLGAVWIQTQEIPYLSATVAAVLKAAASALTATGLLWAIKESLLGLKVQYVLSAIVFGGVSLYIAHRKARRAQEAAPTPPTAKPLALDKSTRLEDLYREKLYPAFFNLFKDELLVTYKKHSGDQAANTASLIQAMLFKWWGKCKDQKVKDILEEKLGTQCSMPDTPWFDSLKEEWIYGNYAHSLDDPKDLMGFLYSFLGRDYCLESFLFKVHEKAIELALVDYLRDSSPEGTTEDDLRAQAREEDRIKAEVFHLYDFARGIALFEVP